MRSSVDQRKKIQANKSRSEDKEGQKKDEAVAWASIQVHKLKRENLRGKEKV